MATITDLVAESHRDLLNIPVAELATIGYDGFPQVTALWFLYDDDGVLKTSLNDSRQKVKNLKARPEASFFFVDPANPYRTLEVRGTVEITPDTDYEFATKLGAKYNADVRAYDQPGATRVVVTLNPVKAAVWG